MNKFLILINKKNVASQIACLINKQNNLSKIYTPNNIINSSITYVLKYENNQLIGCCGIDNQINCSYIRHLSVLPKYRNKNIATNLLSEAINNCFFKDIYMTVRSNNISCLHVAEKLNFIYISHIQKELYSVLTLWRSK